MPSRHYFKTYFALTFFGVVLAIGGYFCWWVWLFQPPVPAGNDPITHLEMIQNFLGNPLLAIKRSQYPVGFHALIAVLSKVFHVKPITMLTSGAPFWLMLPVVSTVLVAKKLFDYRVGYLTLVLSVVLIPFPYLYVGAFPTILVNQTALPLLICWVYYTYVLKEFSKIKLIWHTIAIAIFASYLSLSHYNALAYFYLAMFWLTMLAWARPKLRPRVKYLLIIITAVFGVNLLAYAVNPSLTIAKLVRTLAGQSISASSDQYFLGQADYFAYSHLSLLTQESLAKPNNNVANFLSVPITYLFYACLICAVLLLTRKKIPSPYLPPYLLIGFLSVVYFGVAILPFTPYGGRILLDAMPWFLLFVASTIIFTIPVVLEAFLKPRLPGFMALAARWSTILVGAILLSGFMSVTPDLFTTSKLENAVADSFDQDGQALKSLRQYINSQYPNGATILSLPLRSYFPYLLPSKYTVIGPSRYSAIAPDALNQDFGPNTDWGNYASNPGKFLTLLPKTTKIDMIIIRYHVPGEALNFDNVCAQTDYPHFNVFPTWGGFYLVCEKQ